MSAPTDRPDDPNLGARGEWLARVSEAASGLAVGGAPERPRGSSHGSTITVSYTSLTPSRHKSIDPTFSSYDATAVAEQSKLAVYGFVGIISSVAITAAIAMGPFEPTDIWRQLGIDRAIELASSLSRPAPLDTNGNSAADRSILARVTGRTCAAWCDVARSRRGRRRHHQGTGARDGIVSG